MKTLAQKIEDNSIPEPNTGCWLWTSSCTEKGYGHIRYATPHRAHRIRWGHVTAFALGLSLCACRPDPSSSHRIVESPSGGFAAEQVWPAEHRAELRRDLDQGYARWMTCSSSLRPNGPRNFTWERVPAKDDPDLLRLPAAPKQAQGTVRGTRGILPLSYWLWLTPDARYSWIAHEEGHTFGIGDLDTGTDPAIMSYTASSPDVTARDCLEFCKIWKC